MRCRASLWVVSSSQKSQGRTFEGIRYSLTHGRLLFPPLLLFEDDINSYADAFHMQGQDDLSKSIDVVSTKSGIYIKDCNVVTIG